VVYHKFKKKGTYTLKLTVIDSNGAEVNASVTIKVKKPEPTIPGFEIIPWIMAALITLVCIRCHRK
jgi:hypothetical protein